MAGEEISFEATDKQGKSFTATGKLIEQELKEGRRKIRFWGFRVNPKPVDTNVYVVITYKDGKEYHLRKHIEVIVGPLKRLRKLRQEKANCSFQWS